VAPGASSPRRRVLPVTLPLGSCELRWQLYEGRAGQGLTWRTALVAKAGYLSLASFSGRLEGSL